jgi:hypothetical protein
LVGCVYFFQKSITQALLFLGLALAFDPFKQKQNWNERPSWQKLVLITHLSIVFGLIFIEIFNLFKK